MGLRFRIEDANNIALLLDARGYDDILSGRSPIEASEVRESVIAFLQGLIDGSFLSSQRNESRMRVTALQALDLIQRGANPLDAFEPVNHYFADSPWFALIVPSGTDAEVDRRLCSTEFLREVVAPFAEHPGLILQLTEAPETFDLINTFYGMSHAVAEMDRWPGVLVWTPSGGGTFISHGQTISARASNIRDALFFLQAQTASGAPLRETTIRELTSGGRPNRAFHIVQLSDIHIGADAADERIPRLRTILKQLGSEYGYGPNVLPAVTGDIIDTPSPGAIAQADNFAAELDSSYSNPFMFIMGNHDLKEGGFRGPGSSLSQSFVRKPVRYFDSHEVCVAGFNSCDGAKYAEGVVTLGQMDRLGRELDGDDRSSSFRKVALVHHHPYQVPTPDWLKRGRLWKYFLSYVHEWSVAFNDSQLFIDFINTRKFCAVMHGHKHIPYETKTDAGIPIYGCGSATGMIETNEGRRLISVNIVSINESGDVSCRFHLEDTGGGGLASTRDYVVRPPKSR